MGMMKEFKEFAVKGNVVHMAVGIIIGSDHLMIGKPGLATAARAVTLKVHGPGRTLYP